MRPGRVPPPSPPVFLPGGEPFRVEAVAPPGAFWAKITGRASGTSRYAWTQVDEGDTAAFDAGLADGFAATGTSAAEGAPAYEINGVTGVPTGSRVLLYPAGDLTYYVFAYGGSSRGAATPSGADLSGWAAGLTTTDCVRMTVVRASGACSGVSTTQDINLTWDATDGRWESTSTAFTGTGSGGTGQVTFDNTTPTPTSTIDGEGGVYLGADGAGGLLFAFGGPVLCGGTAALCQNFFVVRFTCDCCPIAGWAGPGWYCVREAGTSDTCTPVELLEADRCSTTVEICSGPYANQAAAAAVCPSAITTSCNSGNPLPVKLWVHITGGAPAGVYAMNWDSGTSRWVSGTHAFGTCSNVTFAMACTAGAFALSVTNLGGSCCGPATSVTYGPFVATYSVGGGWSGCGAAPTGIQVKDVP